MSGEFTAEEARAWLGAVRSDLAALDEKMQPLLAEQRRLEEREALLHNLLQSFETTVQLASGASPPATGSIGEYVVANAIEILRDAGSPMHINDLHAKFRELGLKVPGAGTPANLIVHVRKSPEIASPQRGMYALTELVGPTKPKPRRPVRRRKRR